MDTWTEGAPPPNSLHTAEPTNAASDQQGEGEAVVIGVVEQQPAKHTDMQTSQVSRIVRDTHALGY